LKGPTVRPFDTVRMVAVAAKYLARALKLHKLHKPPRRGPTTIPASTADCHPALDIAFLYFTNLGRTLALLLHLFMCRELTYPAMETLFPLESESSPM
jgi:hypothetical protein